MDYTAIATVVLAFTFAIGAGVLAVRIGYYQATANVRREIGQAVDAQLKYWREHKEPLPPTSGP